VDALVVEQPGHELLHEEFPGDLIFEVLLVLLLGAQAERRVFPLRLRLGGEGLFRGLLLLGRLALVGLLLVLRLLGLLLGVLLLGLLLLPLLAEPLLDRLQGVVVLVRVVVLEGLVGTDGDETVRLGLRLQAPRPSTSGPRTPRR
jgi:hypothetical protein